LTNGQPSGTQEVVTVDNTDSAATENLDTNLEATNAETNSAADTDETSAEAVAAEAAAALAWLTSYFGSNARAVQDNSVLLDTAQLLASVGINYVKVIQDSVVTAQTQGIESGQVYEMYTREQVTYAAKVIRLMQLLKSGNTVDSTFEYRKPYLKQRQLVKIVSDLRPDLDGKLSYQVHLGTLDPTTPFAEPTWREQDRIGGQSGDINLYPQVMSDGSTGYTLYRGGQLVVSALGNTDLINTMIKRVVASDAYAQFRQVVQTEPSLAANSIRGSYKGQLVFWQAMRVLLDQQAAIAAAAPSAN
jgi:hypothetical protein